jgi:mannosyltransferase
MSETTPKTERGSAGVRPAVWLALFAGVILTLSAAFFMGQSLRLDEAQSLWQTSRSLLATWSLISEDVHVPLYHTLLHFWRLLFGDSVVAARSMSLLLFVASVPMVYRLGALAYSRKAGLFAALIFSLSPFMNWYGNEARMYSLLVLVTLANQYWFLRSWKSPAPGGWRRFTLWSIAGVYTHYFFWLVLAAEGLFFLLQRARFPENALRKYLIAGACIVVAFLPWVAFVVSQGGPGDTRPFLPVPSSALLFNTFSQFVFGFQNDAVNTALVSLWPITVLLGFLALRRSGRIGPETIFFVTAVAVPNLAAFAVSALYAPVYLTRYLIFTLPVAYLLLAWLLTEAYPSRLSRYLRWGLVAVMAVTLAAQILSAETPVKENYREAAEYLEEAAGPADAIAVSAPFTIYPVLYYYRGPSALTTMPEWDRQVSGPVPPYSEEVVQAQIDELRGSYRSLWVLQSYDQGYEEDLRIYLDTHLERTAHVEFSPGLNLYAYKLRYDEPTSR